MGAQAGAPASAPTPVALAANAAGATPRATGSETPRATPLPAAVLRLLADARLEPDALALVVADAAPSGARFVAHRADAPMQPASTMKLLTTLAGLETLGPLWRGRTRLLATAPVRGGVLDGDLVLEGGGDMDLDAAALEGLLAQARRHGLEWVRGGLVLDRGAFVPARVDVGVPPFDEGPEWPYNVIPDALLVDGSLLRLDAFVNEQGLQLRPIMPLEGVHVRHEMTLVDGDCRRLDDGWLPPQVNPPSFGRALEVVLRGQWPAGCARTLALNVLDRDALVAHRVGTLWHRLGGHGLGSAWGAAFGGGAPAVREGRAPADAVVLAQHESRPLAELVRAINKPSDNAFTRTLAQAIGRATPATDAEPTLARADRALRTWLRGKGLSDEGFVFDNGSGLSRSERLTAAQLEGVVRAGLASPWSPEWLASLPVAGFDGTLRNRLRNGVATGRARMKTGTLRNVVALAGTLPDASGRPLVLVVLLNSDAMSAGRGRAVADGIVEWAAQQRFER